MKQIITAGCFLLITLILHAQAKFTDFQPVNDTILNRFNRSEFKSIYAMTSQAYKNLNTEQELTGLMRQLRNRLGPVLSSSQIKDLGEVKHYKWAFEKTNMKFELWMDGDSIVQIKLNNFIGQANSISKRPVTDNPLRTQLDSIVDEYAMIYMGHPLAVGLSLGIYQNGKKYIYNYGESEKGTGKPVTENTIYTIGSVSKPFIGILLGKAVTEKKASLDDDIRKYLEGSYPNLEYKGNPVTLGQLSNHTGGFNRFRLNALPPGSDNWTPEEEIHYFDIYTRDSLYRDLHVLKPDTMPGSNYRYSVVGMMLTGMALEKIYGEPIEELVKNFYGNTFGMKDTKLSSNEEEMKRNAKGYGNKGQEMPQMPHNTPSLYSVHSTTKDMIRFVEANVKETDPAIRYSHQLTYGNMKTFGVGLAWDMEDYYNRYKQIWHSGFDYGSISLCTVYPTQNLGMWLWANDDSRQGNLYDMERNIRQEIQYRASKKNK